MHQVKLFEVGFINSFSKHLLNACFVSDMIVGIPRCIHKFWIQLAYPLRAWDNYAIKQDKNVHGAKADRDLAVVRDSIHRHYERDKAGDIRRRSARGETWGVILKTDEPQREKNQEWKTHFVPKNGQSHRHIQ